MSSVNQSEINAIAWKACDTFRGTLDPADYKNYILVALFLKYVSDVIKDHRATYMAEFNGDKARVERRLARERFILPEGADFDSLYLQRNEAEFSTNLSSSTAWTSVSSHTRITSGEGVETWEASIPLSAGSAVFFRLKIVR